MVIETKDLILLGAFIERENYHNGHGPGDLNARQRRQNEDEGAVREIYHYVTNKCGSPDFSGRGI